MAPIEQGKWTRIGGNGNIMKWITPGQTVKGKFLGLKDGKYGQLGMVKTDDGTIITFPINAALAKLNNLRVGADIMIQYTGMETSKSGREFKAFDIFVGNADDYEDPDKHDTAPF